MSTISVEIKQELLSVMEKESSLLDVILAQQSLVHDKVRSKDWNDIEATMDKLQSLSDDFVELEMNRTRLSEGINLASESDLSPVLRTVRGKLLKSKVENKALNEYIKTTRKFLQGVFDSVVPQRRSTLYGRSGQIIRPEMSSIVVNQVI